MGRGVDVRPRHCKFCRKKLSTYNMNYYCFACRAKGVEENITEMERIRFRKYKAQLRYIEKKKKERQRERVAVKKRKSKNKLTMSK